MLSFKIKDTDDVNKEGSNISINTNEASHLKAIKNAHNIQMNESQVKTWLVDNKLKQTFIDLIMPCDGQMLKELYEMRRDAPEFYYQSLRMEYSLNMKDICLFTSKLKQLFE